MKMEFCIKTFMSSLKEVLDKISNDINKSTVDDILAITPDLKKANVDVSKLLNDISELLKIAKDTQYDCQKLYETFERRLDCEYPPPFI